MYMYVLSTSGPRILGLPPSKKRSQYLSGLIIINKKHGDYQSQSRDLNN